MTISTQMFRIVFTSVAVDSRLHLVGLLGCTSHYVHIYVTVVLVRYHFIWKNSLDKICQIFDKYLSFECYTHFYIKDHLNYRKQVMEEVRSNDQRCQAIACTHTHTILDTSAMLKVWKCAFSDYNTDIPNQG